jgi:transcription elongation factor Elf1
MAKGRPKRPRGGHKKKQTPEVRPIEPSPLLPPPCPRCGSFSIVVVNMSPQFMTAWLHCNACQHLWGIPKPTT